MNCFTDLVGSFWTNPQYRIKVTSDDCEKSGEKNILISLMQKPDKRNRRLVQNLHIGFMVFEVSRRHEPTKKPFQAEHMMTHIWKDEESIGEHLNELLLDMNVTSACFPPGD